MKKLVWVVGLWFLVVGCAGPQGDDGEQGLQGADGEAPAPSCAEQRAECEYQNPFDAGTCEDPLTEDFVATVAGGACSYLCVAEAEAARRTLLAECGCDDGYAEIDRCMADYWNALTTCCAIDDEDALVECLNEMPPTPWECGAGA